MTTATTKLIIEDDAGKTIVVPFARDEITIGRKEGNTIRLTERNVSRFHAKLEKNSANFFIEDLGSYNGIKLNGDKIKGKVAIQEGDLIEIGDYHLALQTEGKMDTLPARPANPAPASAAAAAQLADDANDQFAGDTVRLDPLSDVTQEAMPLPDPGPGPDASTVEGMPLQTVKNAPVTEQAAPATAANTAPVSAAPLADEDTEAMPLLDDTDVQDAVGPAPVSMDSIEATVPHEPREPEAPTAPAMTPISQAKAKPAPPVKPKLDRPMEEATEAIQRAPGPQHVERPRLVALNTVFAGMVWPVDRGDAIIGRTDDNDLTIQHKSVSRNHAKIVQEGDKFRMFDLGSANGVLVNGEEIESVILRPGDVVELGRVRLRYVPAGESFSLSHEEIERARLADVAGDDFEERGAFVTAPSQRVVGPKRPPILLGAMALVILLLLVVIVVLLVGGDDDKPPVVENPTDPIKVPAGGDLSEVQSALDDKRWADAVRLATQAKADGVDGADDLLTRATREQDAAALIRKASEAEHKEDFETAKRLYEQAQQKYGGTAAASDVPDLLWLVDERIVLNEVDAHIAESDAAAAKKALARAQKLGVDEDTLKELEKQIKGLESGKAPAAVVKKRPPRKKPKKELSADDIKRIEKEAIQLSFSSNHAKALRKASLVPKSKRTAQLVYVLLNSSAEMGRCPSAKSYLSEYVKKAPRPAHDRARNKVRQKCK
jgi:pSer/pThr/pTyr-binding forkhead associated (FHA) protein